MYYIPNNNDNKRATYIVFILFIILVIAAISAKGQVNRVLDKDADGNIYVCKSSSYPIVLRTLVSKDTLFVYAIADSLGDNVYSVMLYAKGSNGVMPSETAKIWYKDGSMDLFEPYMIDKNKRWVKYNIIGHSLSNLYYKEYIAIEFPQVGFCDQIVDPKYFIKYFSKYNK